MTGPRRPGRLEALKRLLTVVREMVDHGDIVPCVNEERGYLWLSEDLESQEAAALGCRMCPAFDACHNYVNAWPEPSGVWAGRVGKREVLA